MLVDWREAFCKELVDNGYTISIPQENLFRDPVDTYGKILVGLDGYLPSLSAG